MQRDLSMSILESSQENRGVEAWIGFIIGTDVMLAFGYAGKTGALVGLQHGSCTWEGTLLKCT